MFAALRHLSGRIRRPEITLSRTIISSSGSECIVKQLSPRHFSTNFRFRSSKIHEEAIPDGDGLSLDIILNVRSQTNDAQELVLKRAMARDRASKGECGFDEVDDLEEQLMNLGYRIDRNDITLPIQIRLWATDAPEKGHYYAPIARDALRDYLKDKRVYVEGKYIDRRGRHVSTLICNDKSVQEHLLRNGHAWYYPFYGNLY